MKSLFIIIPNLKKGGAEKIMLMTAKLLSKYFYVYLIIINKYDKKKININKEINVIELNKKKIIYSFNLIKKYIRKYNPDYIITTITHLNILILAINFFFNLKIKIIIREANTTSLSLSSKNVIVKNIYKILIKAFYPLSYKIVAVSKGVKNDLVSSYQIAKNKISVIYNYIDQVETNSLAKSNIHIKQISLLKPYILSLGSLSEQKNYQLLIKSFAKLPKNTNLNLVIIGKGNMHKNLLNLSKSLNIKNKVFFLGEIENPLPFLLNCQFFVHCAKWEGLPNVLLEALVLNKYIVSSDCKSGPSEIVENIDQGILFKNNDYNQLFKILSKLNKKNTHNPSNILSKKFSMEQYTENYLKLLNF